MFFQEKSGERQLSLLWRGASGRALADGLPTSILCGTESLALVRSCLAGLAKVSGRKIFSKEGKVGLDVCYLDNQLLFFGLKSMFFMLKNYSCEKV